MHFDLYFFSASLGGSFIFYVAARLLNNLMIYYEDCSKKSNFFFSYFLPFVCSVLYLFGLIPALVIYIIHAYPRRRAEAVIKKEERKFMEKINQSEVRIAVKAEHDRLVDFYKELLHEEREKIRIEERQRARDFSMSM